MVNRDGKLGIEPSMNANELVSRVAVAADPVRELRRLVEKQAKDGASREDIYSLLERLLFDLRANPNPRLDEDAVLDVMDALEGWCHPTAKIT
jgi:hypothetical protein